MAHDSPALWSLHLVGWLGRVERHLHTPALAPHALVGVHDGGHGRVGHGERGGGAGEHAREGCDRDDDKVGVLVAHQGREQGVSGHLAEEHEWGAELGDELGHGDGVLGLELGHLLGRDALERRLGLGEGDGERALVHGGAGLRGLEGARLLIVCEHSGGPRRARLSREGWVGARGSGELGVGGHGDHERMSSRRLSEEVSKICHAARSSVLACLKRVDELARLGADPGLGGDAMVRRRGTREARDGRGHAVAGLKVGLELDRVR
mmetsp:Transcript_21074/g.56758  ORF Transcript_21074/g.56758 Transcript_21074/m.56758 type:complete len:265 (-) Transcript_21074:410-1204(-)